MSSVFNSPLASHVLAILTFIFTLLLASQLLRERRSPSSTIAWLLLILFVPYLGVPLYLLLGGRKIKRLASKKEALYMPSAETKTAKTIDLGTTLERILLASGASPKTHLNDFYPLPNGKEAYEEIQKTLGAAKKYIWISTYLMRNDTAGIDILKILCEKAKQGVQVRLLLDGIGSLWFPKKKLKQLQGCGGQFAFFLPLLKVLFSSRSNLRNHRKMILVDGTQGIFGGMNLSSEYLGPPPSKNFWKDFSFRIRGESLVEFEKVFVSDWSFAAQENIKNMKPSLPLPWPDSFHTAIQVIPSGPDVPEDALYDALLTQFFMATQKIWIATPYFILDEALSRALTLACRRGIDVRILVPKRSNHFIADLCRRSYLHQLYSEGARICLYEPEMMHAKIVLVDNHFALIGSANLDMRSLLLNYEVSVLLSQTHSVQIISQWLTEAFRKTKEAHPKERPSTAILDGIGRILGPMV